MQPMDPHLSSGDPPHDGASPRPRLALHYAALSDVGRVRKDNQDSGFASAHLLVVADGVGGAARGDVASSTAVQTLRKLDAPPSGDSLEALAGAIHRTHDRIAELVEHDPELDGTSTTVTSALFDGSRLGVAHIGDSRGYLLRDGVLSQLTRDHTFVQNLVDEGRITEEESRTHPHRNLILRAVDGVHDTDPDLFYIDVATGDRVLLCSDGVSGVLDRDRLTDILAGGSVDFAAVELVRASLEAGSSDNVTCVVADVVDTTDRVPEPLLVGAAAEQAHRRGHASKSLFRGHRGGDTGEIEPVPGGDGGAGGGVDGSRRRHDPEELRYAPRAPHRMRWLRRVAVLLVVVLVLVVAAVLGYRWSQQQYFVAAHDGRVAIFRGVQADIPGLSMNHVAEETDLPVAALPDYPSGQLAAGIPADNVSQARDVVRRLRGLARVCPRPGAHGRAPVGGGRVPSSPPPSSSPSSGPSSGPSASPSSRPTPSSSPHATGTGTGTASGTGSAAPRLRPPECIEASR